MCVCPRSTEYDDFNIHIWPMRNLGHNDFSINVFNPLIIINVIFELRDVKFFSNFVALKGVIFTIFLFF